MASKRKAGTAYPEINFVGGPLDGTSMMMAEPLKEYYLLDMARSLYIRKQDLTYEFSNDWSIVDTSKSIKFT